MSDLLSILQWANDESRGIQDLVGARDKLVYDRIASSVKDTPIGECLSSLSNQGRIRLLRAPEICLALRTQQARSVPEMVLAEYVFDHTVRENLNSWTAMGDVWLGALPPLGDLANMVAREGRYFSPRTYADKPLDCSLPSKVSFPSGGSTECDYLDPDEFQKVIAGISAAERFIERTSPHTYAFTAAFISNFVLRAHRADEGRFQSATSSAAIGRVLLVNPQIVAANEFEMAEALVHEAVHTAVAISELEEQLMNVREGDAPLVNSPWTGASLYPHAFLHACLVWFALLKFWQIVLGQSPSNLHAASRLEMIMNGFRKLNIGSNGAEQLRGFFTDLGTQILFSLREKALAS
ncbi:hypothetical protein IE4803_PB00013 (plasmid) [Rhizobium etli bv. phaseoli str. IE4803]|nr:hypothetical protein IE4803_PB00013 [Rhizobium etli bv. phaseoli str. IE4803]